MAKRDRFWDFFVAYSGPDGPSAERLHALLDDHAAVFVASKCLEYGDDWDKEIPLAQRRSYLTVILVSKHTQRAYYQREEIQAAIQLACHHPEEHRVVPVYLDGWPTTWEEIPYGLRLKHAIDALSVAGIEGVAAELLRIPIPGGEVNQFLDVLESGYHQNPSIGPRFLAEVGPAYKRIVRRLPLAIKARKNSLVRYAAIASLTSLPPDPVILDTLRLVLREEDDIGVRLRIVDNIRVMYHRYSYKDYSGILLAVLTDRDHADDHAKATAADVLGRCGVAAANALPHLRAVLKSRVSMKLGCACEEAIERITDEIRKCG